MNIPTILIIFGATGDLMRRKLAPALFNLHKKGKLPSKFLILGFSRRELDERKFLFFLSEALQAHGVKEKKISSFLEIIRYQQGDFRKKSSYKNLASVLAKIDGEWGVCSNKLFYLAVAPEMYGDILRNLSSSGLADSCGPHRYGIKENGEGYVFGQSPPTAGWSRIIVEKPFGKDLRTSRELDETLGKLFREEQIYRIDHYLAKEMLQNILAFRFSNNLLEKTWSSEYVERIEIKLWERIGVEKRGEFYDSIGALRDVGQNHLLQMLALATMDMPAELNSASIRAERARVLEQVRIPDVKNAARISFRAQYEGYGKIPGVGSGSSTETYFKILGWIESPRWRGVPVVMESGKRMGVERKEISIVFRHPDSCFCGGAQQHSNRVVFSLAPEEKIAIHFWSKKPGLGREMEERTFEFLLRRETAKIQYVEEYEKLLTDCIDGDQTLFISTEEVRAMWKFIDPFIGSWKKNMSPLHSYTPDSSNISSQWHPETDVLSYLKKEIGIIGLGKMGMNMALRLTKKGWKVAGFDADARKAEETAIAGVARARTPQDFLKLSRPRVVLVMVPSYAKAKGAGAVDEVLFGKAGLDKILEKEDIVIDGGNSYYEDSKKRAARLEKAGIHFIDAGISGGPAGALRGSSIMVGGSKKIFTRIEKLFADLAVPGGYGYVGESGSGHFAKMVHNGIEYGMMQALAEGFYLLRKQNLDVEKVAEIYNRGSVIESRLTGWAADAFREFGRDLKSVSGSVAHTGEGEWTVKTARRLKLPSPVIEAAFAFRVQSKKKPSYAGKILMALRNKFGGHSVR